MTKSDKSEEPELVEIAMCGDLNDIESDVTERLLETPPGSECVIYFNCPGGNPHSALSIMSIMMLRDLQVVGIVAGECSSAALWPLAACKKRYVSPHSCLLFHPLKSESEQNISHCEAIEWVRYMGEVEKDMDELLARLFEIDIKQIDAWMRPGKFVGGVEFAEAGLAELVPVDQLAKKFAWLS